MAELDRLVQRHRVNGLLIDTNLFLLYLIGSTNEQRISRFERTQQFTVEDFRKLATFVNRFQRVVTTPHVLTEVSNLARLKPPERDTLRAKLRQIVQKTNEVFTESHSLMSQEVFVQLGLTDTAIITAASEPMLVLTDDFDLYRTLNQRGVDVINFNHLRPLTGHAGTSG